VRKRNASAANNTALVRKRRASAADSTVPYPKAKLPRLAEKGASTTTLYCVPTVTETEAVNTMDDSREA
jgi:hypothetical protein